MRITIIYKLLASTESRSYREKDFMSTQVWNIWNKVDLLSGRKTETYYEGDEETGLEKGSDLPEAAQWLGVYYTVPRSSESWARGL